MNGVSTGPDLGRPRLVPATSAPPRDRSSAKDATRSVESRGETGVARARATEKSVLPPEKSPCYGRRHIGALGWRHKGGSMKRSVLPLAAVIAVVTSTITPAQAAPACVVVNWSNGDSCYFEAPTREFVFGGISDQVNDGERFPWVAVQVSLHGQVLYSCYDRGTATEPAQCVGRGQAFAPNLTHKCQVFGPGGPKFHCADPPPLPLPLP